MNISGIYQTQHGELAIEQYNEIILATYQDNGICSGIFSGDTVNGIWKNKKDSGIFSWKFENENEFKGSYKSGVSKGSMKGKWDGKKNLNNSNQSGSIKLIFEIINDNTQQSEAEIEINFQSSNLKIESSIFNLKDYDELSMNSEIISKCKLQIEETDLYFLQNSSHYSLRLTKVNTKSLSFLWDTENTIKNSIQWLEFLNLSSNQSNEEIEEKSQEFRDDYYISLDYVKGF